MAHMGGDMRLNSGNSLYKNRTDSSEKKIEQVRVSWKSIEKIHAVTPSRKELGGFCLAPLCEDQ